MTALPYIAAYLLGALSFGALSFGVFVLVLMLRIHRKPPSITKHARREQTVDVHYTRQYRDARKPGVAPWNKVEVEPVEPIYMYGVMGLGEDR